MIHGRIVFSWIMDYLLRRCFKSCVKRYRGDYRVRTFSCLDQCYCMAFAQLAGRESLRDIAMILIDQARMLYARKALSMYLKRAVYALDATVIDLCLSLFPWAQHRRRKSAVRVHTQLDLRSNIQVNNYQTSESWVFVEGVAIRGASLVVHAIRSGRDTATAIDQRLRSMGTERRIPTAQHAGNRPDRKTKQREGPGVTGP